MQKFIQNYIFTKDFNYFINLEYRIMFILYKSRNFIIKLPPFFFFLRFKNIFKILFINYMYYQNFCKYILRFYSKFFPFYYCKLKLKGLGFRIRVLSKFLIRIYYNRSNYYYMHIPNSVLLKYRTRQLFFLSTQNIVLKLFLINLLLLKKFSVYRFNGLIYPRVIVLMKPGKNKFR